MRKSVLSSLDISHIFRRSLTIVQPSLPKPGFFARHLALPDVYFFTKANCTPFVDVLCLVKFDGLDTTDQLEEINIEGPGTKTVVLVCDILPFHGTQV